MPKPSPEDDYSDFDSLFSGKVGAHEQGSFQLQGSAEGFRYRKQLIADLPYISKVLRDNWKIQLVESEKDDAKVLFEQDVNYGINIIALPGPLPVFIATPAENEQIKTTIINGETIAEGKAIEHLDLGYKTEFGITTDFTASPGVDNGGGGEVTGAWQSLPYRQDVSEGNIFRIIQDGWRPIGLSRIATYSVSFKAGTPYFSALFDDVAATRIARNLPGAVEVMHSYGGFPQARARLRNFKEPSLWKDDTNRMWLGALALEKGKTAYKLYWSDDDFRTHQAQQTWSADDPTQKTDVTILDSSYRFPRAVATSDGGVLVCAVKDSQIWTVTSPDGLDWSYPVVRAGRVKKTEPYMPLFDGRNGTLRLTNGRDHLLESLDGGLVWKEVEL